jgi:DNA-binding NarL/FixJ family response regulator
LKGQGQYSDRQLFPIPAFVLLDHAMPCDGLEVLQWVRKRPEFSSLAVVIFTGSQNPEHEAMVMKAGANAYHLKPQSFGDFVKTIRKIGDTWLPN